MARVVIDEKSLKDARTKTKGTLSYRKMKDGRVFVAKASASTKKKKSKNK